MAKTYISIRDAVSSGTTPGVIEYHAETFNIADWSGPVDGYYHYTVLAVNHGKSDNVTARAYELVSGVYEEVDVFIQINGALDVSIRVDSTIDNRFQGKLLIL